MSLDRVRAACAKMEKEFFPDDLKDLLPDLHLEKIKDRLSTMRENREIDSRLVLRRGRHTHLYSPGVRISAPRVDSKVDIGSKDAADRLGEALGMPVLRPINEKAARNVSHA